MAGLKILWANDNLPDACKSYTNNIDPSIVCRDVLDLDINDIPKADVLIGGPPCQGFSGVGKRDPNDIRSQLVWKYLDIVNFVRPTIFLFENVLGIRSSKTIDGKNVVEELQKQFGKIGYKTNVHVLNSADYGVPQRRKRIFIVGNLLGKNIDSPNTTHSQNGVTLKKWVSSYDSISDLGNPSKDGLVSYIKNPDNDFLKFVRSEGKKTTDLHIIPYASEKDKIIISYVKPGGNYLDVPDFASTKRIMYFKSTGGRTTTYGRLDPAMPSYTLNTHFNRPNVGCNIHYSQDRLITIREGLRIQSFPDHFSLVSSSKRNFYLQVGNAVPPLLGFAWAKHIKKIFEENKK
jgi:DNA (cytosine-5)-methyltransferase 1